MKKKISIEGLILSVLSMIFIRESLKLHNNKSWALSPALFPLIITSMALFFSLSLIISNYRKEISYEKQDNKKIMLFTIVLSFLYYILLGKISFTLSTGLYLLGLMYILGERRLWIIGSFIIIVPLSVQYIFENLLGVVLP